MVFGPKSDEIIGKWRMLRNEKLNVHHSSPTSYYSGDQIKKNEMIGAYSTYGGEKRSIQGFNEPEGKKSLGIPRRRWIFRKWQGVMNGVYLAYSRDRWRAVVGAVMNLRVP